MLRLTPRPIALLLIAALIAALCVPLGLPAARSVVAQGGELLTNPGFEDPFVQAGSADIFVANGWQAWYVVPDSSPAYPSRCVSGEPTCKPYQIPTFRPSQPQNPKVPPRSITGNSQQWGTIYAVSIAGVYQQVSNITPGTRLHFSAHTQGFNCSDDRGCFGGVGQRGYSYEAGDMQTRVGIDPTGGTNAFASTIVWSAFANPLDAFVQQDVEAVAQANTVTVFVWASPTYPEKHTDVYVDDASLSAVGQGPAPTSQATQPAQPTQPTQPAGTAGPTPTLAAGATTYTVQGGDTLFAIALKYNLTLDQLLALNPSLTRESVIQIGQVINVAGEAPTPGATAQPTATPQPSPTPAPTVIPTTAPTQAAATTTTITSTTAAPTPTQAVANSGLCLLAFDDQNGNGVRDTGETLIAGAAFQVKSADGQSVATYTTDGTHEPHCMSNLADGRYTVNATLPPGRRATTDQAWSLALLSGTSVNIALGSQVEATPTSEPTLEPTPAVAAQTVTRTGGGGPLLALLGGGALILLAGVALFFGLRSRRKTA